MAGPTHQAMPRIGDRIDRYEICGEVDSGGMSVVYAVKRIGGVGGWSKLLAMKVILPNLARQERFSKMFMDEARILSLIQHANVVQVHDVGETESGLLYMVMELLRGRSLSRLIREALRTDGTLDRAIMLSILADAAEGLHGAHETRTAEGHPAKIVHRDVSPQNIHIGFDGSVKVLDFGIAAAEGRLTETRTGELKGKLSYIAPEQILRHATDRRADVWSIGVMAWELLAGRRLFTGDNEIETLRNVDAMEVPPIGLMANGLPPRVAETIMKSLSRDPAYRPATAALVATALREGARGLGTVHADSSDALAERRTYVQRLLGTEMVIENERLAAAVREGPPPPVRSISPEEEISDPFRLLVLEDTKVPVPAMPPPVPRPRRRLTLAAGAAGAALLTGLAVWALTRGASAGDPVGANGAPATPARTRPVAASGPATHERPAPAASDAGIAHARVDPAADPGTTTMTFSAPRTVEVILDPRIRAVRVDGRLVTDRPLLVSIRDEPVVVEAVGPGGARARRVLDRNAADRVGLTLPRAGESKTHKGSKTKSPLLDSPYRRRTP